MPDDKLFRDDPDLHSVETAVIERGTRGDRQWVRLEKTVFYPEGGGQPADRGTIQGIPVVDVQSDGDEILHFVERPVETDRVTARIDSARRLDVSQQHTAQHLLTAWLLTHHDLPTTTFHLGEDYSAIEVPGPPPDPAKLRVFEDEVNALVRENRSVTVQWAKPEQMQELGVRSRLLPRGHTGSLRLVRIADLDLNTCGGTHVGSLAEIQVIHIIGAEPARGGARIHFIAGHRVLKRLRAADDLDAELKKRIGSSPDHFVTVIDGWQTERKTLKKQIKTLQLAQVTSIAAELIASTAATITHVLPDSGPDQLRALATAILEKRPEAVVVLAGETGTPPVASFIVQSGSQGPDDVSGLGTRVRNVIGAKGGGKGRTFQGRGGRAPTTEQLKKTAED